MNAFALGCCAFKAAAHIVTGSSLIQVQARARKILEFSGLLDAIAKSYISKQKGMPKPFNTAQVMPLLLATAAQLLIKRRIFEAGIDFGSAAAQPQGYAYAVGGYEQQAQWD